MIVEAAPGVANPTLDGNEGNAGDCQTSSCNGPAVTVQPDQSLVLNGITIQDADNTTESAPNLPCSPGLGGAVLNEGTLTVSGSTFSDDKAITGGAIANWGVLQVSGSTFSGNTVQGGIGALIDAPASVCPINQGAISWYAPSAGYGGAIANEGEGLTVSASTFLDNIAGYGGAIDNEGVGGLPETISASTFSHNSAVLGNFLNYYDCPNGCNLGGLGGAINNEADLIVSASTFSGNTAAVLGNTIMANYGEELNGVDQGGGTISVVADIFDGSCYIDYTTAWSDEGYNVGSDGSCSNGAATDRNNVGNLGSLLAPLGFNGGPTETMPPTSSSGNPAVGIIPNGTSETITPESMPTVSLELCPTTDQRGVLSIPGQACNAGSVQTGTVTVDVSGSQTYGSSSPTFSYTDDAPSGLGVAGELTCSTVNARIGLSSLLIIRTLSAGTYTVSGSRCSGLSLSGTNAYAYTMSYTGVPAGFVVDRATLSITASSARITYSEPVPAITASLNGFVNGNTQSSLGSAFGCSTTATSSSSVGTYPSSCTGAVDDNYAITYVDGTVTVVPAPTTVSLAAETTLPFPAPPGYHPVGPVVAPGKSVVYFATVSGSVPAPVVGAVSFTVSESHAFPVGPRLPVVPPKIISGCAARPLDQRPGLLYDLVPLCGLLHRDGDLCRHQLRLLARIACPGSLPKRLSKPAPTGPLDNERQPRQCACGRGVRLPGDCYRLPRSHLQRDRVPPPGGNPVLLGAVVGHP